MASPNEIDLWENQTRLLLSRGEDIQRSGWYVSSIWFICVWVCVFICKNDHDGISGFSVLQRDCVGLQNKKVLGLKRSR